MAEIIERQIGNFIVRIDRHLCVGFGDCIDEAPTAFVFDEDGIVAFLPVDDIDRARLISACDICPVDAISVFTIAGEQVA